MAEGEPQRKNPTVFAATLSIAGTRMFLLIAGVAVGVIVARALGPTGRGEYASAVVIATLATNVAHLSVEQAQIYLSAKGVAVSRLVANAVILGTGLGVGAALLTALAMQLWSFPVDSPLSRTLFLLPLIGIPLNVVTIYTNGLLILSGRIKCLNRAARLGGVLQLLILLLFIAIDRLTVEVVTFAWLVNAAAPLFVSLPSLKPRWRDRSPQLAKEQVRIGASYHGGMLSLHLLLRVDILLLTALSGPASVGLYALAVSLVEMTNIVTDSVKTAVLRQQTAMAASLSGPFTARIVGVSMIIALLVGGMLASTAPVVIPFVYGADFAGAATVVMALLPGVIALAGSRSASGYLIRLNRPWLMTGLAVVAMVVNVALNLLLIPRWGIHGAAVASSVSYSGLAAAQIFWLRRSVGLKLRDFWPSWRELVSSPD